MTHPRSFVLVTILTSTVLLTGCTAPADPTASRAPQAPANDTIGPLADVTTTNAGTATCFDRATTPAVIETVTEQVLVQPESLGADGSVITPAAFRTVTRQRIVQDRREVDFEIPCASVMTPEFNASVQRALLARGYYRGAVTGVIDGPTRAAIERFQRDQGDVPIGTLSLRSARSLGLVTIPRDQF